MFLEELMEKLTQLTTATMDIKMDEREYAFIEI